MSILDILQSVAEAVVPPPDADHNANFWWRWRVAIVSCTALIGVIGITALAFGLTPGFEGFAKASDLKSFQGEQRQHWVYQLDQQILDFRIKQCKATTDEAKQLYAAKIAQLEQEYRGLTNVFYTLPACTEL